MDNNVEKNNVENNRVEVAARELLERRPQRDCYMIYRLEQGMAREIGFAGESVRMQDAENQKYLYAVNSMEEFIALYEPVRTRQGLMLSLLTDGRLLPQVLEYDQSLEGDLFYQLIPPKVSQEVSTEALTEVSTEALTEVSTEALTEASMATSSYSLPQYSLPHVKFSPVTEEDIPWILSVYEHPEMCADFIRRRSRQAPAIVARVAGNTAENSLVSVPVGFAMTHCNAELGPVYVEPEWRGTGLSAELLRRLLVGLSQQGDRAAVYVTLQNQRSLHWLQKQGFYLCPQRIAWFWRK